ncbi:MAG: hypothetical protein AAF617_12630 [Bacteroidota bacterium]
MKRKKSMLRLQKFTIASLHYMVYLKGAGQSNDTCHTIAGAESCQCYSTDPDSCSTSTDDPLSNQRKGCASHIGGGD